MDPKVALVILDGRGISTDESKSAISQAKTPTFDTLWATYPHTTLEASGGAVGLPDGQMGNSEVGHMSIGAGRVLYQDLVRINKAIQDKTFHELPAFIDAIKKTKATGGRFHLLGMISDKGVHAHLDHLLASADVLETYDIPYYIHGFTDGRDCDPRSGIGYVRQLTSYFANKKGVLATLIGRYYAMDRNLAWERTKEAYDLLVHGKGIPTDDFCAAVQHRYDAGVTDEFIAGLCTKDYRDEACIRPGDAVLFVNFRNDRPLQLVRALSQESFPAYNMSPLQLTFLTMTSYDPKFVGVTALFKKQSIEDHLGEVMSKAGKTQLRIAETEKYAHVTFFFNGGKEEALPGEARILIPSPKVATYDITPGMSSEAITTQAITYIQENSPHFVCLNYAAPDMVGHTGNFQAVVDTCEIVDRCLEKLTDVLLGQGYQILILADHGNAEYMLNDDGSPNTAHSTALVPCLVVGSGCEHYYLLDGGSLVDVAPTLLHMLDLPIPEMMTGRVLIAS